MYFTPIDLQTWPRSQMFCYFAKMAPTGYSLTVQTDVTALRKTVKDNGLKFFPAYLWLVTKRPRRAFTAADSAAKRLYGVLCTVDRFHAFRGPQL